MDIREFLEARIAEDEAIAHDGASSPQYAQYGDTAAEEVIQMGDEEGCSGLGVKYLRQWLPARALAECRAKRAILVDNPPVHPENLTDDEMHQRRSHPAYEYDTTEGQRKAWADSETPPEGDGWEKNATAADPEAFERFDYSEESYWRRLRPEGTRDVTPYIPPVLRHLAAVYASHPDYDLAWATEDVTSVPGGIRINQSGTYLVDPLAGTATRT